MRARTFALALLLAAPALGADKQLGINVHQSTDVGMDVAKATKLGWVRIDFNWLDVETQQGVYDWSRMDAIVAAATSRNLKVLAVIGYTPKWASTSDAKADGSTNDVPKPGLYEAFVKASVDRYKATVTHWEIWNEPNLEQFFEGTPDEYTSRILVPGAKAVHAACASCKVVAPGLATVGGKYDVWMDAALAAAKGDIDIVSGHVYATFVTLDVGAGKSSDSFFNKLEKHRVLESNGAVLYEGPLSFKEVMDKHGVTKPFWLTETGLEASITDAKKLAEQTKYVKAVLASMPSRPWWEATLFYEAFDEPPAPYTWGFAVHDPKVALGYTPKPVMDAVKTAIEKQPAFGGNGTDCNDGLDNDFDGLTDGLNDPGCTMTKGQSEVGPDEAKGGAGGASGSGGASAGVGGGGAGAAGTATSSAGTSSSVAPPSSPESSGCGCEVVARPRGSLALVGLVAALAAARRRQKRNTASTFAPS